MEEADAALALALQLEEEEAARQEQQAAALAAAQSRADEVAQNLTYGLTLAAKVKRGKRRRCGKKKGKRCLFNLLLLLRPPLSLSLSPRLLLHSLKTAAPVPGLPRRREGRHPARAAPPRSEAGGGRRRGGKEEERR